MTTSTSLALNESLGRRSSAATEDIILPTVLNHQWPGIFAPRLRDLCRTTSLLVCVCMCVCVRARMFVCVCVCKCVYVCVFEYCIYVHTYLGRNTYIHTCTYKYTYIHTDVWECLPGEVLNHGFAWLWSDCGVLGPGGDRTRSRCCCHLLGALRLRCGHWLYMDFLNTNHIVCEYVCEL